VRRFGAENNRPLVYTATAQLEERLMRPTTKKQIAVLAALFTFAFPALAGATIVINRGMFGVDLGNTMNQVRRTLGRPDQVDPRGGATAWSYYSRGLLIDFSRTNRVHDLSTESLSQSTASGVGIGSSETAVMRLGPAVHCPAVFPTGYQGFDCIVASGHVFTKFHITSRRGLVQYVLISRVR
jgi:hypothetical protein